MSSSRLTAPSGGKAQSKFRLLLALAGLAETHGVTEIGPLVAASVARVVAPFLIVSVPFTEIGVKSGRWRNPECISRVPSM